MVVSENLRANLRVYILSGAYCYRVACRNSCRRQLRCFPRDFQKGTGSALNFMTCTYILCFALSPRAPPQQHNTDSTSHYPICRPVLQTPTYRGRWRSCCKSSRLAGLDFYTPGILCRTSLW